jgi:hypothetical protein
MEILKKNIKFCEKCNNYKGTAEEKGIGEVKVHCACTLKEEQNKYGHYSTYMVCSGEGGILYRVSGCQNLSFVLEITNKNIQLCKFCNNYTGTVEEKYNGKVPVHCLCMLKEEKIKYGHWRSPCMVCPNGERLWWTPLSSYRASDGKSYTRDMCHLTPTMNNPNKIQL